MGTVSLSQPVLAAFRGQLAPIVEELNAAGFVLQDRGKALIPDTCSATHQPIGIWAVSFQDDDHHQGVVISIHGWDRDWGVSVKASLCGLNGGVCYWAPLDEGGGEMLDLQEHWPGLEAAVSKARDLAQRHRTRTDREVGQ